jgi:hypothetical protein
MQGCQNAVYFSVSVMPYIFHIIYLNVLCGCVIYSFPENDTIFLMFICLFVCVNFENGPKMQPFRFVDGGESLSITLDFRRKMEKKKQKKKNIKKN